MSIRQIKWGYPTLFQGILRRLFAYWTASRTLAPVKRFSVLVLSVLPPKLMTGHQIFLILEGENHETAVDFGVGCRLRGIGDCDYLLFGAVASCLNDPLTARRRAVLPVPARFSTVCPVRRASRATALSASRGCAVVQAPPSLSAMRRLH